MSRLHGFTILEVSPACYAELRQALLSHEERHCIADTGAEVIDMTGIAVARSNCLICGLSSELHDPPYQGGGSFPHPFNHKPTLPSANAVKEQAHVERSEERQQQKPNVNCSVTL